MTLNKLLICRDTALRTNLFQRMRFWRALAEEAQVGTSAAPVSTCCVDLALVAQVSVNMPVNDCIGIQIYNRSLRSALWSDRCCLTQSPIQAAQIFMAHGDVQSAADMLQDAASHGFISTGEHVSEVIVDHKRTGNQRPVCCLHASHESVCRCAGPPACCATSNKHIRVY